MSILSEAIQDEATQQNTEDFTADPEFNDASDPQQAAFPFPEFSFLRTPTGEGAIEDYLQHPLNINNSKGMAQILRGFTGIAGDLKLAVIDIFLGSINLIKENKING